MKELKKSDFSGIRAISFDGDGTLWDFDKVLHHSLSCVLEELEKVDPNSVCMLTIDKMTQIRRRVANQLSGKVSNLEMVRLEAFRQTLRAIGRPNSELASHLNQVYLKHRFEDIELFSDVLPTLETLRKKLCQNFENPFFSFCRLQLERL